MLDFALPAPAPDSLEALVAERRLLAPESLARARSVQQETGEPLEAVITRLGLLSEAALAAAAADACRLPLLSATELAGAATDWAELSPAYLRDSQAVPLSRGEREVVVALANPFDPFTAHAIGFALGRPVRVVVACAGDIDGELDRRYGVIIDDAADPDLEVDAADLERLTDLASDAPVIRAVNRLISQAVEARASDIHVEPAEDRLIVRLRVDGSLYEVDPMPAPMRLAFVSRLKVMAGLNIAEKRLPQDGRLRLAVRGHEIDLRIATAPSIHGESVVLRILDRSHIALDFAALGFDEPLSQKLAAVLSRPHGIVLVTGPTGSGKTTTLYAALATLNTGDRKVLTIEDPIEYRLPGIVQAQVAPAIGLDFSSALRSFLRQDPDVMMVGEIRDIETAQVAVQAALTGHTILSTLHTNTAASAVTRLLDMGVEPFLITSTLNAVLAQRLVRRLCPQCREPYTPPPELLQAFGDRVAMRECRPFYRGVGCEACNQTGFKGRLALIELLIVDEAIGTLVLARAAARDVHRAGLAAGMREMLADGLLKAEAGLTTLEEVLRVTSDDL